VMHVPMAGGVEQHAIAGRVTPAMRPPDLVMVVPSGDRGDRVAAVRAASVLAFPEGEQRVTSLEGDRHLEAEALFDVDLPLGIVGIHSVLDLGVPGDVQSMRCIEMHRQRSPFGSAHVSREHPVPGAEGVKVALFYPVLPFIGMSPSGPPPEAVKDCIVHRLEHLRADHMAVIHRPAPNEGVEVADECAGCGALVVLDQRPYLPQDGQDALGRWLDEQLAVVLADVVG